MLDGKSCVDFMVLDESDGSEGSLSTLDMPQIRAFLENQCSSSVLTWSYKKSGRITVPGSVQNPCGSGASGHGSVVDLAVLC